MASGKLSTRQKMINMMYLVLTALLALSVSSEILQAFESLRSSLEKTAKTQASQNLSFSEQILKAIDEKEKGGISKYSYVRGIVMETNKEADGMVKYLDEISRELEEMAGKNAATGELEKKDELDKNYRFWLGSDDLANGGRGNGKAQELHKKLDAFVEWANELFERHDATKMKGMFVALAVEPKDDASITDKDSKGKTWEYHSFHDKPVIADMAMVEKLKMDVRGVQTTLLNMAQKLTGAVKFTVDSLIAFEAPSAHVVAAGMKYTTVIGVGMASKSVKPEFVGNGITLNEGGSTATMTLTANGSVIPQGQYEGIQHYTATIKVPNAEGEIETIPVKGQFKVRKPEVVVRSKELQVLYKDCGNTVIVDVPSLGDQYNPDFSKSTGGKVVRNAQDRKEITIVPNQPKFDLEISSNTNGQTVKLDKLTYRVIQPNKPRIVLMVNGNEHNPMQPINRRMPVEVKLVPDKDFAASMPRDARYSAQKVKLWYKEGLLPAQLVQEVSGAQLQKGVSFNLSQGSLRQALPGGRIYFEVVELRRTNFEGRQLEVPGVTIYDLNIAATFK